MYKIKSDSHRNLLYVFLNNSEETNLPKFVTEIEKSCNELITGFVCILVLPKDPFLINKDKNFICNTGNLIYAYGARKIVRVMESGNEADLLKAVEFKLAGEHHVENANSITEAEEMISRYAWE
jgi:hypothetical protein